MSLVTQGLGLGSGTVLTISFPVKIIVNGVDGFPRLRTQREDEPTYVFEIQNLDGTPFSLESAGAQVTFTGKVSIKDPDGSAVFSTVCTIDSPASAGFCRATLTQAETNFSGNRPVVYPVDLHFQDNIIPALTLGTSELEIFPDVNQTP